MAPITVYIVDDEPSVGQALARLTKSAGMRAKVFETVPELVDLGQFAEPVCVNYNLFNEIGRKICLGPALPRYERASRTAS